MRTFISAVVIVSGLAAGLSTNARAGPLLPDFSHIYVIVMENHEFSSLVGSPQAPYINSLIQQYGLATGYTGVSHPSLPNYMSLTGGQTAFDDDCVGCTISALNIADELEVSGRAWKAYQEDMPGPCTAGEGDLYTSHHNPFVHYADIVNLPSRCQSHVVPMTTFGAELDGGTLPRYVWITPNLCSDMHDCSIATGDAWLQGIVPAILRTPDFSTSVLFLTWDEGTTNAGGGGRVPLVMISPSIPPGFRDPTPANHFNLLRTIEDAWNLAPLGAAASAAPLTAGFAALSNAPTGFAAGAVGSTAILSWHAPAGPTPANYVLELGTAPGLSNLVRASTGSPATFLVASGVPVGSYYLRVKAQTSAGLSTASNETVLVVGNAPGAPTQLGMSRNASTVSLSWHAPTTGGAPTTYLLDIGSALDRTDLASVSTQTTATTLSFPIAGAASGFYYLRIRAQNASGNSFPSNETVLQVP